MPEVSSAPWSNIKLSPSPEWALPGDYDAAKPARDGWHVTLLLWMRQLVAGTGQSFHASALRLETSVAVQHQSQWRLDFDARTQQVTLHWLEPRRG